MCCVLNRVGKGDQFLVIVERTGPALLDDDCPECGAPRSQQELPESASTGRAGGVMPGVRNTQFVRRCSGRRHPEDIDKIAMTASSALTRPALKVAALGAYAL